MTKPAFDEYAETYDAWFLENRAILESEILLLRRFLQAGQQIVFHRGIPAHILSQ